MFAEHCPLADSHAGVNRTIEVQILRIVADDRKRMHHDASTENASPPDDGIAVDDTALAELCALFDKRRRMNTHAATDEDGVHQGRNITTERHTISRSIFWVRRSNLRRTRTVTGR